jgi:hypothetical protein
MGEELKKTKTKVNEDAYEEWESLEDKKTEDMIELLKKHTDIDNVEEMVEARDNIDFIVEKHPELIDHDTSTDELMDQWEETMGDVFGESEQQEEDNTD